MIERPVNPKTYQLNGCFLDDDRRFCFINIHKNASKSMRNILGIRGKYYNYHEVKSPDQIKICVFRDPIQRLVSIYQYLLRLEDNGFLDEHPTHLTKQSEFYLLRDDPISSFESFLRAIEGRNFFDSVLCSQQMFLDDHGLKLEDLDVIMIQENIEDDFEKFKVKYNLEHLGAFPCDNQGNNKIKQLLLEYIEERPEVKEKIRHLYEDDYELYCRAMKF